MNRRTFVSFLTFAPLLGTLASGCGKKQHELKSRLEYLEESVVEKEQYIKDQEANYKADYALAKKNGDKERMAYLKATNEERLKNEKKMLEMEKKELEKERKNGGK